MQGTHLVCDAPRTASGLAFLSHAEVAGPLTALRTPLTATQVLLSQHSANLLEAAGHPLGSRGLVAAYGRPFALGTLRVELFPSGYAPGAASLLCESPAGRVVYAGPVRLQSPPPHTPAAEIRPADALCVDATFADPQGAAVNPQEVLAQALAFVRKTLGDGHQPVVLAACHSPSFELVAALSTAGVAMRAHPSFLKLAAVYEHAGLGKLPLARFSKNLGPQEALLWPVHARGAAALSHLPHPVFALASGFAGQPAVMERAGASVALQLCPQSDGRDLLAYVKACGARQVATINDLEGRFAALLRSQGFDAYSLGPPAQMPLFTPETQL